MAFQSYRITVLFCSFVILVCTSLNLSCNKNNSEIDKNTLAVVGEKKIETEDFIKRYNDFRSRTGVEDNGQARRSILKDILNEELLISEARRRGYDKDSEGQHELERIKIRELLNAYHQKMIDNKITVSEDELYSLYIRMNTKLKARHLYAPTYEQAANLYQELQEGKSFEELAKKTFKDPVLKNSGGLLGYFSVDEMVPAFEEAAYNLKVGETSKPIRTNDGYSIIRVDDKKVKPLLTEYEFAKHRSKLLSYWKVRKSKKMTQLYVDSLKKSLKVAFNEPILHRLFLVLNNNKDKNFPIEQIIPSGKIKKIRNEELVRSDIGAWDVEKFQENARYTSEKQQGWIRSEENLKDFISGLIVLTYMLSEGKKMNLNKTPQYENQVSQNFDDYLLDRIDKDLYNEIETPEDSLLSYYNQDPQRFVNPPKVNLKEIVLDSPKDTLFIKSQLKKGISFSDLAKKYSVRRWSAEKGGELGYLSSVDLGKWSPLAFSIEVGKWVGPINMSDEITENSHYVFLKCIGKMPSRIRTFEEAKENVQETLRTMWWQQKRDEKIKEIRNNIYVVSFPEKLMTVRLN